MANEYMTLEELKATRELTGKVFADMDMARELETASRAVDELCDRRFYIDTVDVTRYYTARSPGLVFIDDLSTPAATPVTVDGQAWTLNTDYVFEPLNGAADGKPYTHIGATGGRSFPLDKRKVAVTGRWGWATVPPQVKTATGLLATILLLRVREAPMGVVFGGLEQSAATRLGRNDPQVMMLLSPFMEGAYLA